MPPLSKGGRTFKNFSYMSKHADFEKIVLEAWDNFHDGDNMIQVFEEIQEDER